jgi:hypothetical protein
LHVTDPPQAVWHVWLDEPQAWYIGQSAATLHSTHVPALEQRGVVPEQEAHAPPLAPQAPALVPG